MKAIKKIVALGLGATMVGATILGASAAASLNQYPAPFVSNGKFTGTMVIGDKAAAEDVIGVTDIAMGLQYAVSGGSSGSTGGATTEGDVYQFTKSSDKLNLWQNLSTIRSTLTEDDLNSLADGSFKGKTTETYTQKIEAPVDAAVAWEDYNTINEDPALYLKFGASKAAITYKLNFQSGPSSDIDTNSRLEDFENNKITILGKEYTITKAENLTGSNIRLTLMSGAVQDTLEVGQTKTYNIGGKDYEVTVMIVSGDVAATAVAKLIVNDEVTKSLSKDDTYTLKDGTDIGIKEVLPTKSGDAVQNLVEFYLGAQKLVLDDSDNALDIGDDTSVEDVNVAIANTVSGTENKLTGITLTWTPGSALYVPVGGSLVKTAEIEEETDYVSFLNKLGLDYSFTGLVKGTSETVTIGRESDDAIKIKFTNKNGVAYDVPVWYYDSSNHVILGKESGKDLYLSEGNTVCDEDMFVVESDSITRVLQLTSVKNTTDSKYVKLKDIGTGDSTQYDWDATTLLATVTLDGYDYKVKVNDASTECVALNITTDDADNKAELWTKYGTMLNITARNTTTYDFNGTGGYDLVMVEDKDKQEDDDTQDVFKWNMTYDSTNTALDIANIIESDELNMLALSADSKKSQGYSKWGTFFERDTNGDQDSWKITIPQDEASPEVFLSVGAATITASAATETATTTGSKIEVGAAKLASELTGDAKTQNLILVGGPCANSVVEKASADFPACSAWPYQTGESLIQLVNQADGHVALLVAGTDAADTRTAAAVVAQMTKLKALPAGTVKQKVTVVNGQQVLTNVVVAAPATTDATTPTGTTE